METTEVLWAAN